MLRTTLMCFFFLTVQFCKSYAFADMAERSTGCAADLLEIDHYSNFPMVLHKHLHTKAGNSFGQINLKRDMMFFYCPNETNHLAGPNGFEKIAPILCWKGTLFNFEDARCKDPVRGTFEVYQDNCGPNFRNGAVLYRIGFRLPMGDFITVMEACWDQNQLYTLFTKHRIQGSLIKRKLQSTSEILQDVKVPPNYFSSVFNEDDIDELFNLYMQSVLFLDEMIPPMVNFKTTGNTLINHGDGNINVGSNSNGSFLNVNNNSGRNLTIIDTRFNSYNRNNRRWHSTNNELYNTGNGNINVAGTSSGHFANINDNSNMNFAETLTEGYTFDNGNHPNNFPGGSTSGNGNNNGNGHFGEYFDVDDIIFPGSSTGGNANNDNSDTNFPGSSSGGNGNNNGHIGEYVDVSDIIVPGSLAEYNAAIAGNSHINSPGSSTGGNGNNNGNGHIGEYVDVNDIISPGSLTSGNANSNGNSNMNCAGSSTGGNANNGNSHTNFPGSSTSANANSNDNGHIGEYVGVIVPGSLAEYNAAIAGNSHINSPGSSTGGNANNGNSHTTFPGSSTSANANSNGNGHIGEYVGVIVPGSLAEYNAAIAGNSHINSPGSSTGGNANNGNSHINSPGSSTSANANSNGNGHTGEYVDVNGINSPGSLTGGNSNNNHNTMENNPSLTGHTDEKEYWFNLQIHFRDVFKRIDHPEIPITLQQLSPKHDFAFTSERVSTLRYINSAPMLSSIAKGHLVNLEQEIRRSAAKSGDNLQMINGVHDVLELPKRGHFEKMYLGPNFKVPVPKYIWKMIIREKDNTGIVFVLKNSDQQIFPNDLCPGVCGNAGVFNLPAAFVEKSFLPGNIQCCTVEEFLKVAKEAPRVRTQGVLQLF